MSIELVIMLCAGVGAIIQFFVSYREKKKEGKGRAALIFGLLLGAIAGVAGVENHWRTSKIATVSGELEREWVILGDTRIEKIEIEMVSPDGVILDSLFSYARKTQLRIQAGVLPHPYGKDGKLSLSQVFTAENLVKRGRLGINVSQVRMSRESGQTKAIKKFERVDCLSSAFITGDVNPKGDSGNAICSVTVALPLSSSQLRLKDIEMWQTVSVSQVIPADAKCLGVCKHPLLISVRLLLQGGENFTQTMIEISPSVLMTRPSTVSESSHAVTYELTGKALLELAKSYYLESYGYRKRESFALTKGLFHSIYVWATRTTETVKPIDIVWTTNPSPDSDTLRQAIPPAKRASAYELRLREWCGFGGRDLCWHRFLMSQPGSKW